MQNNYYKQIKNILCLSIALICTDAFSQYKWVTQNGQVVYSDSPPPVATKVKKVEVTAFVKTKSKVLPVAQNPTKPTEGLNPASAVPAEEKKSMLYDKQACEQLLGYLKILQDGGRVAKLQSNGEKMFLDDKSRQNEITETQRKISEQCKKV